jgi:DnaK suppressor protein
MADDKFNRYEAFKKILLDKKRKMWSDLREEYFVKLGKEYRDQFDNPQDLEDLSLLDLELTRMDEALDRLEDGTYGLCAECGLEIDEGRLKVMPFAIFCVPCQKEKES